MKAVNSVLERDGFLPRTWLLQMDNCWRENKNRYVFDLMSLLVHWDVFEVIEVGFLLVGHTHDDIDQ
jgi:hypothetical protein